MQTIPIVILTARSEEADVVAGLNLGADDISPNPSAPKCWSLAFVRFSAVYSPAREKAGRGGMRCSKFTSS